MTSYVSPAAFLSETKRNEQEFIYHMVLQLLNTSEFACVASVFG